MAATAQPNHRPKDTIEGEGVYLYLYTGLSLMFGRVYTGIQSKRLFTWRSVRSVGESHTFRPPCMLDNTCEGCTRVECYEFLGWLKARAGCTSRSKMPVGRVCAWVFRQRVVCHHTNGHGEKVEAPQSETPYFIFVFGVGRSKNHADVEKQGFTTWHQSCRSFQQNSRSFTKLFMQQTQEAVMKLEKIIAGYAYDVQGKDIHMPFSPEHEASSLEAALSKAGYKWHRQDCCDCLPIGHRCVIIENGAALLSQSALTEEVLTTCIARHNANEFMVIGVSVGDLLEHGYNVEEIDNEVMLQLAAEMRDAYEAASHELFGIALSAACEKLDIKRQGMKQPTFQQAEV